MARSKARCRRPWPSIPWPRASTCGCSRRWRRSWPRSRTTSPTPTTTSTTACAPASWLWTSSRDLPLAGGAWPRSTAAIPELEAPRRVHETIRRLIDGMVRDLIDGARRRLAELAAALSPDASGRPRAPWWRSRPRSPLGWPSCGGSCAIAVYRHYKVSRMTLKARRVVRELADALLRRPRLPAGRLARARGPARHAGHRRHRTGLYRRHDRSLRARRARPPVQA